MTETIQPTTFYFERAALEPIAERFKESFATAQPFPHVVIDNLLPESVLDAVLAEFPEPEQVEWQQFDKPTELKLALADTTQMGAATRNLLAEFNGQVFIQFLETLTGIDGLVPDPHYSGGGLHQIRAGGFLKIHADFNRHTRLQLDRRLNVLLYLNRDWPDEYGGKLELWDTKMTGAQKAVLPVFNRMVVFATTDHALHGHPEPLSCPPNRARRSLALYYYSNGRPESEVRGTHSTLFQARPGEKLQVPMKERLKRWIPVPIMDFIRARKK
jgi:Rps23 Pro-64 3,4-dihydroxylase Tpa1-like proline 4-hydroxylase